MSENVPSSTKTIKVCRGKDPFIKVVEGSQRIRSLALEMKEWPDALTMFSQGPNILEDSNRRKTSKITFCELSNVSFSHLQNHLKSR